MIGNRKQIFNYLFSQNDDDKFEINPFREKRGLQANKYYWSLLNELANVLRMSKEDLHLKMLEDYGQGTLVSVIADADLSVFKYYSEVGESILNGKTFKHIKVYKPSSEMNRREFSILLDGLIQECKGQDIETLEDKDIKEMIRAYATR